MKYIKLSQNQRAKVDNVDYQYLNQWKWSLTSHGYALRMTKEGKAIYMHKLVNNTPDGFQTDHANGDRLDNRRENLRSCTISQNRMNSRIMSKYNTSGYRGVYWHKQHGKWNARIQVNKKGIHLGLFTDKIEAAKAYDIAAVEHHGEFASLNFGAKQ